MIVLGNTILSDDIAEEQFVCDLSKCKGACCVEGDLGAPLTEEELPVMEEIQEQVKPYLTEKGRQELEKQGAYIKDYEGDYSTPTIEGKECAYAIYDEKGVLKCGIEEAYNDGKISFHKPVSCHLYPVRVTQYDQYEALNYDRWSICSAACDLGKSLKVPVYKFVKDALIRKYGKDWYTKLEIEIRERADNHI
ncbi:DUF3109 family protein [Rapidithrix thailandica]|uniref:DUF3109 family protein n=1 Tax=Rapidithrix thailandica TaxID=413964 RepID=A0AAW9S2D4_9BACT